MPVPLIAIDSSLLLLILQDLRIFRNDEIGKDEIENMFRVLYIAIILSTPISRELTNKKNHLAIITGHRAYDNTPDATLPISILLKADLPFDPTTIRSMFSLSAY